MLKRFEGQYSPARFLIADAQIIKNRGIPAVHHQSPLVGFDRLRIAADDRKTVTTCKPLIRGRKTRPVDRCGFIGRQHQGQHVVIRIDPGQVERGLSTLIRRPDVGAAAQQQCGHFMMAAENRQMKRGAPIGIPGIDFGPGIDHQRRALAAVVIGRQV